MASLLRTRTVLAGSARLGFLRRLVCDCRGPSHKDPPRIDPLGSLGEPLDPVLSTHKATTRPYAQPAPMGEPQPERALGRDVSHLFEQNTMWADENKAWFEKHGSRKHSPRYLWIGCSDARVPANQIIGEDPGEVFVHRNIANLVVNSDMNLLSVIQYAVGVLGVAHIIVCGHYDCGGIKAAMGRASHESRDLGSPLEDWLRNIRDVYRLHQAELEAFADADARHRRLVELNVIEQCLNVYKTGPVQRRRLLTSKVKGAFPQPRVHGVVYDPHDGRLKGLDTDFGDQRRKLGSIYDLFESGPGR